MPLPQVKEDQVTKEELTKRYEDLGWKKTLEFDWIEMIDRQPYITRYRYNADTIPCDLRDCVALQLTFVRLESTGVIWTCGSCRKTDGPITTELGQQIGPRRAISLTEAWDVISLTGQYPPVGLEKPPRSRRFRIIS